MKTFFSGLTENINLKLISVIIAVVIWYLVVYNNDPQITQSYQVPIQVTNESYIENGTQVYRIYEEYKTVTVYLTGNRSSFKNVTADKITVTADLTQIVDMNLDPIMVPLSASCSGFDPTDISLSRTTIPIVIESVASKELQVSVVTGESTVNKNYEIGKMTPDPQNIVIYGAQSIISTIDSVVASVNVSNLSRSSTLQAGLIFYDKDQNEISGELSDDIVIDGGITEVNVYVDLWKKQSDIGIEVQYDGKLPDGYEIAGISTLPETLTLAGTQEALETLLDSGNKIIINSEDIDLSRADEDCSFEIQLDDFLPDDIILASTMNDTVIVNFTIIPVGSGEISISVDDIQILNLSDDLSLSYDTVEIALRVTGSSSSVDDLKVSQISASIDLADYDEGDYTVDPEIDLPSGYELVAEPSLTIHLKAK